jgi:3',5'-cyclic AMP phosphodiesterase CpdA
MTRFLYVTDTHLGADNEVGYTQQPRRADRLPALLGQLDAWIARSAEAGTPVAFVLHGGDMVDAASPETVRAAAEAFRLSIPVYLCLGNHDVTRRDALQLWLAGAPDLFPGGRPTWSLTGSGWRLHHVPTQWGEEPYFWDADQRPHFLAADLAWLEAALARDPDAIHLLSTHNPVLGVSPEQTGRSDPYHAPPGAFTEMAAGLLARFPQLKLVLGGHNHINSHGVRHRAHLVTGSAFVETPFEFKVIDVTLGRLDVRTVALLPQVDFQASYDWDKTFVQGRACDRGFSDDDPAFSHRTKCCSPTGPSDR